jgi:hypothetical protein
MDEKNKLTQYDLKIMKRRDFLRVFLLGGVFTFLRRKVKAEQKPEEKLKKAMFWRRRDI